METLRAANISVDLFSNVVENPTTEHVSRGVQFAQNLQIDFVVGLGGGSSMDCAKGINFILTNGGRMQDYWGVGKAKKPLLPMIAIPCTAGTGSDAQSFAIITDPTTHQKMACGDPTALPRVAILDPNLTQSQPPRVCVLSGLTPSVMPSNPLPATSETTSRGNYPKSPGTCLSLPLRKRLVIQKIWRPVARCSPVCASGRRGDRKLHALARLIHWPTH